MREMQRTVRMTARDKAPLFGLWMKSEDQTVGKDIKTLSGKYHQSTQTAEGAVLPFYVLSKDYDEKSRKFELFIGSTKQNDDKTEAYYLPECEYASMTVRPKLGFLWGLAVGEAKRYFYTKWLPVSGYRAVNLEYEYHTEKSIGKHPTVEVIFAVEKIEDMEKTVSI